MVDDIMFSSETDEWATPPVLVQQLEEKFGRFDLDPCADERSAKAPLWFGPTNEDPAKGDGLSVMLCWAAKNVFVNPPFSRKKQMRIEPWIEKAWSEVLDHHTRQAVLLIPARTETRIWHDVIFPHAALIAYVKGRINFIRPDGTSGPAPFPSAIVVFRDLPDWIVQPKFMAWEQPRAATPRM